MKYFSTYLEPVSLQAPCEPAADGGRQVGARLRVASVLQAAHPTAGSSPRALPPRFINHTPPLHLPVNHGSALRRAVLAGLKRHPIPRCRGLFAVIWLVVELPSRPHLRGEPGNTLHQRPPGAPSGRIKSAAGCCWSRGVAGNVPVAARSRSRRCCYWPSATRRIHPGADMCGRARGRCRCGSAGSSPPAPASTPAAGSMQKSHQFVSATSHGPATALSSRRTRLRQSSMVSSEG